MFVELTGLLVIVSYLLRACAAQHNGFSAQTIRDANGACMSAFSAIDGGLVTLEPCDGSLRQSWDGVVNGRHIRNNGFALFVLSGTNYCLDSAAIQGFPGLYTCGGISDGSGSASVNEAFTYSLYRGGANPLVLIPLSRFVNNGQGDGQGCLTVIQARLNLSSCDPASPRPEQRFVVSPPPSPSTNSSPSANSSTTAVPAATSQASKRVNPVVIAVPISFAVLLVVIVAPLCYRFRSKFKQFRSKFKQSNNFVTEPYLLTPSDLQPPSGSTSPKRDTPTETTRPSLQPLSLAQTTPYVSLATPTTAVTPLREPTSSFMTTSREPTSSPLMTTSRQTAPSPPSTPFWSRLRWSPQAVRQPETIPSFVAGHSQTDLLHQGSDLGSRGPPTSVASVAQPSTRSNLYTVAPMAGHSGDRRAEDDDAARSSTTVPIVISARLNLNDMRSLIGGSVSELPVYQNPPQYESGGFGAHRDLERHE